MGEVERLAKILDALIGSLIGTWTFITVCMVFVILKDPEPNTRFVIIAFTGAALFGITGWHMGKKWGI